MTRKLEKGNYMALFAIVVIAVIIIINLIIGKVPAKHRKWDLSTNQILTLGDTIKDILSRPDKGVTIHIIASPDPVDERVRSSVSLYANQSPRTRVMEDDPALRPDVLTTLDAQPGQVLMVCKETGKKTVVSLNNTIQIGLMAYYQYQQIKKAVFDGKEQVTSVVGYAINDNEAAVYTLTGYQESALSATTENVLEKSDMILSDLNPITDNTIPQDCGLLIINNPQTDISQDGITALADYLKSDGHLLLLSGATQNRLANLPGLCSQYGMDIKNRFVIDSAPRHFYNNNPFYVISEYDFSSGLLSGVDSEQAALAIQPSDITIQEDLGDDSTAAPLLTTSDSDILADPAIQEKTRGTYVLAAAAVKTVNEEENTASMSTVIIAPELVSDDILTSFLNITNLTIFMNAVSYRMPGVTTLSIPSKSLDITYNMVTSDGLQSTLSVTAVPAIFLVTGFVVWVKRRKL